MRRIVSTFGRPWPALLLLVVIVAVWTAAVEFSFVSALILPHPLDVVTALIRLVGEGTIWPHLWATLFEAVAGFAIGALAGVVLAVASGLFILMRRALYPYVIVLQVTPLIAVAPLVVAWLGFGYSSKVAIAALICFFPIFINTLAGITSVGTEEREMFRSLGASRSTLFFRLMLPHAVPTMFAGFKTAMTLALIGAVVGEFVSAERGLGLLVSRFSYQLAVPSAFAVVIVLALLGLLLFVTMVLLEWLIAYWQHDRRLAARSARLQARHRPADATRRPVAAPRP